MKSKRESGKRADNLIGLMGLCLLFLLSACGSERTVQLTEFMPLKHQILPGKALVQQFEFRRLQLAEEKLKKEKSKPVPMMTTFIAFNY